MVHIVGTLIGDDGVPYNISISRVARPAQATSITLLAAPAGPQPLGTLVTLTATVLPATATGSVVFTGTGDPTPVAVLAGTATQSTILSTAGTLNLGVKFTPADPSVSLACQADPVAYVVAAGDVVLTADSYSSPVAWSWQYGPLLGSTASCDQCASARFSGCATTEHSIGFELRAGPAGGSGIRVAVDYSRVHVEYSGQTGAETWNRPTSGAAGVFRAELAGQVVKLYVDGVLVVTVPVPAAPAARGVRCASWHDGGRPALSAITASSLGAVAPQQVPSAPVLVAVAGDRSAVLSWTDPSRSATSFAVCQNSTRIATTPAGQLTVTGLSNGAPYSFNVSASNSAGASGPSNVALVVPAPASQSSSLLLGAAGTGAGNGALDRWMTHGPGVVRAMATWSDAQPVSFTNVTGEFGSWTGVIDVAIGAIWNDSWSSAAGGAWDSYWRQKVTALRAAWGGRDPKNMRIRFAHEFNGNWMPWSVNGNDAASFKIAFQRFTDIARSVMPGALVVWSPNDGNSNQVKDIAAYWPGLSAADRVGVDSYNQYPHAVSVADVTSSHLNSNSGFETWRQRCAGWGVTMCVPEWANAGRDSGGGAGGGDAPNYVSTVLDWAKRHGGTGAGQVEYLCYFNIASGYTAYFQLFDGSGADSVQPMTSAAFRAYTP